MVDIPEHLLLRSAEARAKALGIPVEQALAEMKGESTPTVVDDEPEVVEVELTALPIQQLLGFHPIAFEVDKSLPFVRLLQSQ